MSPSGPRVFSDERGYFYESFNAKAFRDATGDALHAVLCAAGFNLRWLMRAVQRGWIRRHFAALFAWVAMQLHGPRSVALAMRA